MGALRVAVLGLGMMGSFHVELLSSAVRGAQVSVVNDFVTAKAEEVAARVGARAVADPIAAINDAEVDAVLLATPGNTHLEQVLACLERGIRCCVRNRGVHDQGLGGARGGQRPIPVG